MPHHNRRNPNYWMMTELIRNEVGDLYLDRPLIGRDDPISGGVYYGTYGGEAIVVDPHKYPEEYDRYYEKAARLASVDGQISRPNILKAVFDTVTSEMPYSQEGVDEVLDAAAARNGFREFPDGGKVELSTFMQKHAGVCRHQALACAVLLEKFKEQNLIGGAISIDRNAMWNPTGNEYDGHAWARYTAQSGNIIILDVAQEYIGRLQDTNERDHWNYLRPEEQAILRATGKAGVMGLEFEQ